MNEAIRALLERRSIRAYTDQQVPDGLLNAVLEAGLYAASGMNTQSVRLVAVRDRETRDLLSRLNAAVMGTDRDPFYGAPCVVVVLADPEIYGGWVEDGALALGNMMNAAHALGLGSCWIHRARQVFDAPEGKELLKKWGLPEPLRGVGNCILGYPACAHPNPAPRKEGRIVKIG
ncbi:MAG: nitroreductase [Oscillospiraceae bacterium]|nr:nitroreductase [Oscillospiraceae bacterium]